MSSGFLPAGSLKFGRRENTHALIIVRQRGRWEVLQRAVLCVRAHVYTCVSACVCGGGGKVHVE